MTHDSDSDRSPAFRLALTLLDSRRSMVLAQLDEARAAARYAEFAGHAGVLAAIDESIALLSARPTQPSGPAHAGPALVRTLMRLQLEADCQRDAALNEKRWAEVSSLDGRSTGFMMALRIVQDEFQPARQRAGRGPDGPNKRKL